MSDRFNAITVTLEDNLLMQDVEPIINAIKQIRGVISVSPMVEDPSAHIAQLRAKHELRTKLWDVLKDDF